jgi:hypothetical protein
VGSEYAESSESVVEIPDVRSRTLIATRRECESKE